MFTVFQGDTAKGQNAKNDEVLLPAALCRTSNLALHLERVKLPLFPSKPVLTGMPRNMETPCYITPHPMKKVDELQSQTAVKDLMAGPIELKFATPLL